MEAYAQVLLIAIPVFFVLIIIEALYGYVKGEQTYNAMDTISSLSSGITNTLFEIMGLTLVVISYSWLVDHLALMTIENTILIYILCFITLDFAGYCNHRLQHSVNFFWNIHIIHHSSEEFNLACALRQTISNLFGVGAIFLVPAALIGIPAEVIAVVAPLHLFLQFWYHTRHIGKLGFLEYIIITPSQHRVHHAINDIYLDKNMGQIFSFWDRIFGTFQEELEAEPPVYGVKRAVRTWNPITINYQHLSLLFQDAWRTDNIIDKFRIWWMPTGWRPADVAIQYPISYIEDPHEYTKYGHPMSKALLYWTWFQFLLTNALVVDFLIHFAEMGWRQVLLYGCFLFTQVYAYSTAMDHDRRAPIFELIKSVFGISILWQIGTWFLIDQAFAAGSYFMLGYLIISPLAVYLLTDKE